MATPTVSIAPPPELAKKLGKSGAARDAWEGAPEGCAVDAGEPAASDAVPGELDVEDAPAVEVRAQLDVAFGARCVDRAEVACAARDRGALDERAGDAARALRLELELRARGQRRAGGEEPEQPSARA